MKQGSGKVALRAKARLIRTLLGDEMVSNEIVAVVELVKNAYDADAENVIISISPGREIVIIDDGHGMTLDTVLSVWTQPATLVKKKNRFSPLKGRRVLGNKGIGRFASFRLGGKLEVVTRALNVHTRVVEPVETRLMMDWSELEENDELYLDEVFCNWETREPVEFGPNGLAKRYGIKTGTGTLLRITKLDPEVSWDEEKVTNLRVALSRLVSPNEISDFTIKLDVPYDNLSGPIDAPEPLKTPDYRIFGEVDAEGVATLTYESHGERCTIGPVKLALPADRTQGRKSTKSVKLRKPQCGPFKIDLKVWDRDRESLATKASLYGFTTREIREMLDRVCGVSVYRDSFRVFPYGESGDDWLRLDLRRVQNPTLRVSNNQIVGVITIGADTNPLLIDQSNREGFIRNQAVEDLIDLVLLVLSELEARRYVARRDLLGVKKPSPLFSGFELSLLRQFALEREQVSQRELLKVVDRQERQIKARVKEVQEAFVRYRRLASMGKLVDEVLHEGRQPLGKIDMATDDLLAALREECLSDQVLSAVNKIRFHAQTVSHVLRKVEPFSGKSRSKPRLMAIEPVIHRAFDLMSSDLRKVRCELPETHTLVLVDEYDMLQVFVNLIDNSVYWLRESKTDNPTIRVDVHKAGSKAIILFCDNGPGVPPEYRESIFDPYFTLKDGGTGLGLVIVGEIVTEHEGQLELMLDDGPLPGACFRITLPLGGE